MTHLDISNTSYGQKKGRESNHQFDSWPLEFGNRPDYLACRWHATYSWKVFNEGYNFAFYLISIGGLHAKLWAPKLWEFRDLGVSGQITIWLLVPLPTTEYTMRGKVMVSHKVGPRWVLWVRVCSWFVLATKVFQLCLNRLVVWFVQICVSD
jgi:hypothetical protein